MNPGIDQRKNYAVAILLGAIGGGLFVALATRAIPKMMAQIMLLNLSAGTCIASRGGSIPQPTSGCLTAAFAHILMLYSGI